VENGSRLKRIGWSVAAIMVAATIWFSSPLGNFFLFPRHQQVQDKIAYFASFLFVACVFFVVPGKACRKRKDYDCIACGICPRSACVGNDFVRMGDICRICGRSVVEVFFVR